MISILFPRVARGAHRHVAVYVRNGPAPAQSTARLKITLDGVEPAVFRRVEGPLGLKLPELRLVIQAVMVERSSL